MEQENGESENGSDASEEIETTSPKNWARVQVWILYLMVNRIKKWRIGVADQNEWFILESTVNLRNFGVVSYSVFSVVNGFTEIKKVKKWEEYMEWSQQHLQTPKFKLNRLHRDYLLPKF